VWQARLPPWNEIACPVTDTLDSALIARLREVLADEPSTESELRALSEQADAWARILEAQIQGSERRLDDLTADSATPLREIAAELRRVEKLSPARREMRFLLAELEARSRELRTAWLLRQADSAGPLPVK
jgi:hypothetical protein